MSQLKIVCFVLLSVAVLIEPLLAAPIFWFLPWSFTSTTTGSSSTATSASSNGASNSSNVSVAIGNRVNTSAGLDDYGTNITNVQINVNRMRRAITEVDLTGLSPGLMVRALGDLPANGSFISVGEHTIHLPANVSNLTVNTYLINGVPEEVQVTTSPGSSSETSGPLQNAIGIFKKFVATLFGTKN
ncbi:uncharacterized protein LOC128721870 [Anopheles nili]|uniref:uncharacterized protein LOC128721870 n=1 Tax=Anopheles nili TaxID=185578 RepID=UPI00237BAFCA|nr:uncharacterized protein LOC128721870 [Anopheles nili]